MPYITAKQPPVYYQISFEDMMAGIQDLSKYVMPNVTATRTYWVDRPNTKLLENTNVSGMIEILAMFNQSKEALFARIGLLCIICSTYQRAAADSGVSTLLILS